MEFLECMFSPTRTSCIEGSQAEPSFGLTSCEMVSIQLNISMSVCLSVCMSVCRAYMQCVCMHV